MADEHLQLPVSKQHQARELGKMASPQELSTAEDGSRPNINGGDKSEQSKVAVVIVPFPAQGHLNQLLHLSRIISSYGLPVHFAAFDVHSRQARLRLHGWDPLSSVVRFHEFPTPHFLSPAPKPNGPTNFPSHLQPSFEASAQLQEPISKLVAALSKKVERVAVIYDGLMGSVVEPLVSMSNVEAYLFHCSSAFGIFWRYWGASGMPDLGSRSQSALLNELPSMEGCFSDEFKELIRSRDVSYHKFHSGVLLDTCRLIEDRYLELLADLETKKGMPLWALGPFNQTSANHRDNGNNRGDRLFAFLDKQSDNSTVYVSFGTTTSLSEEQAKEIAIGLERSAVKFVWVVRESDRGNLFESEANRIELPEGYEERVEREGKGVVVREWAPQLEILGHPAVGGFVSHCGWNSCMEGITMGVPIAAWPMHSDQPRNAMLITKVLRTGLTVREWEEREETVTSARVEEAVRRLMTSKEMRCRAEELGGDVRRSLEDGGITRQELDSFVAHIARLGF